MMTYAAILRFAALASRHALTDDELLTTLRTARAHAPGYAVSLAAIEQAVSDILAARERLAA